MIGGTRRQVRVEFDPLLLAARDLVPTQLIPALQQANRQQHTGTLEALNRQVLLQTYVWIDDALLNRLVTNLIFAKKL